MNRVSLKCACCGNQDLQVIVNELVPRGIYLSCNKMGCGSVTPIAFFDEKGKAYAVNGIGTMAAYDETYCGNLTTKQAWDAIDADDKEVFDKIHDALEHNLGGRFSPEIMEKHFPDFPFRKNTETEAVAELANKAKWLVLGGKILLDELLESPKNNQTVERTVRRRGR